jgi:integrase/recombinase XerC
MSPDRRQEKSRLAEVPGSARLAMVGGVVHLNEEAAVFEAMLDGWSLQQRSRLLADATVAPRLALLRRFVGYADSYPCVWGPDDVEDFTVALMSGEQRLAPSTIRGYHLTLRMFCDYLCDPRYGWVQECRERFGLVPSQPCHEWNTVAHLNDYEGNPARRPFSYDELQVLFDYLDDRVERVARLGRKGALAALRDAQMIKTVNRPGFLGCCPRRSTGSPRRRSPPRKQKPSSKAPTSPRSSACVIGPFSKCCTRLPSAGPN